MSKQNYQNWRQEQVFNMLMEKFVPTSKRKLKEVVGELTPEQNMGIKKLYLIIKRIVIKLIETLNIDKNTVRGETGPFFKNNENSKFFPPGTVLHRSWKLIFPVPEEIKKLLQNLDNTFELVFNAEPDQAGLVVSGLGEPLVTGMQIGWDLLRHASEDMMVLLPTIQHELQHIVDFGGQIEGSYDEPENFNIDYLKYLSIPGELAAHAKQFAYIYHKIYPNDKELDIEKFKSELSSKISLKNLNVKIVHYLEFALSAEDTASRDKIPSQYIPLMKETGNKFLDLVQKYFKYFKKES
jgi:hypothetical protein